MSGGLQTRARLEAALGALVPADVAVAVGVVADATDDAAGFAVEAAAMARARPVRRVEFFAGRAAARRAMRALGHAAAPVPMGPDRAPVWPEGLVGSITHGGGVCAALVGRAARYCALSVDIEPDEDLPADLVEVICLPSERGWLDQQPPGDRGRMARLIFSAKETVFKLQYPLCGRVLEFDDVEIAVERTGGRFAAKVAVPLAPVLSAPLLRGRFVRAQGRIFCAMVAPRLRARQEAPASRSDGCCV